jgi:hypothetical protein
MKNLRSKILQSAVALMVGAAPIAAHGQDGYTVIFVVGEVSVTSMGKTHQAAVSEALAEDALLSTGSGSMADISLAGKGVMRVQENTKVSVASLSRDGREGVVNMIAGKVMVIMAKLFKGSSYEVKTSTQVASVRGTIFQVSGDESQSRLDVLSGKVKVNPIANGIIQHQISKLVSDNQSLTLDKLMVLDIIAKKKKFKIAALRRDIRTAFMMQVKQIRESPQFQKFNEELKTEINNRVMEIKRKMKEKNLDQKMLRKKMREEKEKLRKQLERNEKQ